MTLCYSHKKNDPFARIDKGLIFDKRLSLKAKMILVIAFSRPSDWKFYKHEMMSHSTDGEDAFDSGIKELETIGYLHRKRQYNYEKKRLEGWEWHFFEEPVSDEDFQKKMQKGGKPDDLENQTSDEPPPNKNDLYETKKDDDVAAVFSDLQKEKISLTQHLVLVKSQIRRLLEDQFSIEDVKIALEHSRFGDNQAATFMMALIGKWERRCTKEDKQKIEEDMILMREKEKEKLREDFKKYLDDNKDVMLKLNLYVRAYDDRVEIIFLGKNGGNSFGYCDEDINKFKNYVQKLLNEKT